MELRDYADALNLDLEITRYANQGERWSAQFKDVEILEGGCLASAYGNGTSVVEAVRDYARQITGKRIAVDAYSGDRRREYVVPSLLTWGPS